MHLLGWYPFYKRVGGTKTSVTPVYQGRIESCPDPCSKCMGNAVNAFVLYVFICPYTSSYSFSFSLLFPYEG